MILRRQKQELPPLEPSSFLGRILKQDAFAAFLLLGAALAALLMVNLGHEEAYHHMIESRWGVLVPVMTWDESGVSFTLTAFDQTLHFWINEGLMAIFFFLVGLEIKRELLAGELASVRKAMLPAVAALGGMLVPALIYAGFNLGSDSLSGWGIPMATDIAFAIGCLSLLGRRIPLALSVFLIALAIVDDLGAVLVIALFYTESLDVRHLVTGGTLIGLSYLLSLLGVRRTFVYVVLWFVVWLEFLESGVHATLAGVLIALTIPPNARYETPHFQGRMKALLARFDEAEDYVNPLLVNHRQQELIRHMMNECKLVEAPLQRIEHSLHPITMLFIMPLFAFANSGIHIEWAGMGGALFSPVTLGVFFGLLAGKQLGILSFSWLAVRLGLAELPEGVTWKHVYGLSWLAGIGFTMALFISQLAFPGSPEHLLQAKLGIFTASVVGGVVGYAVLRWAGMKSAIGVTTEPPSAEASGARGSR